MIVSEKITANSLYLSLQKKEHCMAPERVAITIRKGIQNSFITFKSKLKLKQHT